MSAVSSRWRRWAVALVRHAASIMPDMQWANAMRRELDYIANDPAALRWALGCVAASYRIRLTRRPRWNAGFALRQVAAGGALMLLIGVVLQDRAGGQTVPPQPTVDERACDEADAPTAIRPNGTTARRHSAGITETGRAPPECADAMSKTPGMLKIPGTPSGR